MGLSPETAALVLLAALLHAVWNALVKSGGDRLLAMAAVTGTGAVVGGAMLPFVPPPHPASWVFLFLSWVFHHGYFFFLLQAYRVGDLSHVYPLARGSAPLLVLLGAVLFAGEHLSATAAAGLALAAAGIISLSFDDGPPWRGDPRPFLFALGTGFFIAAYTVADGMGVRLSQSPLGYIAWLFFIDGWLLPVCALAVRRGRSLPFLRSGWKICAGGGAASMAAYGLVIYAMDSGSMSAVAALRETSVVMAVLIGTLALGERFGRRRAVAAIMVAAGVAVMNLLA